MVTDSALHGHRQQGGAVIGTFAAQGGGRAVGVSANEALGHHHMRARLCRERCAQGRARVVQGRFVDACKPMGSRGVQGLAHVPPRGGQSRLRKPSGHERRARQFSRCHECIVGLGSKWLPFLSFGVVGVRPTRRHACLKGLHHVQGQPKGVGHLDMGRHTRRPQGGSFFA